MGAFTVFLILGAAVQLSSATAGVCRHSTQYVETYQVYTITSISYVCWSSRCIRYHRRSVYHARSVLRYGLKCCSGYEGDGNQCSPICNGCNEPHICEAPNTCVCHAGWTGEQCSEDIDECQTPGICEHQCINTAGNYHCSCPNGNVLADDHSSCIESPWNVTLSATGPTSLRLTWEYPQQNDVDGTLAQFSVSCPPDIVYVVSASQSFLDVGSLSPYSVYNCCVTANTTKGLSNPSCDSNTTLEDVPSGAPENVTMTAVSPYAIEIKWGPPSSPNGVIVLYTVYINSIVVHVNGSNTHYFLEGLLPYQQINVSVSASTMIGEGPQSGERMVRTHQAVPLKGPTIVSADRTEATRAVVKWEHLDLEDLRGNLVSYEIVYYYLLEEACPAETYGSTGTKTVTVTGRDSTAVITNLNPRLKVCVAVAATTGTGVGDFSYITIPLYTNTVFTVAFKNIQNCTEWILKMQLEKSVDVVQAITIGINQSCHCQFSSDYIGDGRVLCDQEACHRTVFQGRIISTNGRTSTELLQDLEMWISSNPTVVVQGKQLQVVSSEPQSSLNCDKQEKSDVLAATLGSVVGVILVLLCIITATAFGVIYCKWRPKNECSGLKSDVTSHEMETNPAYGLTKPKESNEEPVSVLMYDLTPPEQSTVNASNDKVYSEVATQRESHIYDAPARV